MPELTSKLRTEYRRILRVAREDGLGQFVGNRYPWQCQTAIQELSLLALELQRSKRAGERPTEIRILTATFPAYVFSCQQTFETLKLYLESGGTIRVLIWNKSLDPANNLLLQIAPAFSDRFEVRVSETDHLGEKMNHFFVVDNMAFRLEEPHLPVPSTQFSDFHPEIPAKITFRDELLGSQLVKFFDHLWQVCAPTK